MAATVATAATVRIRGHAPSVAVRSWPHVRRPLGAGGNGGAGGSGGDGGDGKKGMKPGWGGEHGGNGGDAGAGGHGGDAGSGSNGGKGAGALQRGHWGVLAAHPSHTGGNGGRAGSVLVESQDPSLLHLVEVIVRPPVAGPLRVPL